MFFSDKIYLNVLAVDGVMIGHVDCTAGDNINKELCNSQGVNGFPTLNIYKDGVKVIKIIPLLSDCTPIIVLGRGV